MTDQSQPPLPELVAKLHLRQATGQLAVRCGDVDRRFLFTDGELRAARSSREQEKLGSWLVSRQRITANDRSRLLHRLAEEGGPSLGHLLADSGLLDHNEVDRELQALAVEIIQQAARQTPHETIFAASLEEALPWDILPDFSTPQMILVIAREFPDRDAKVGFVDGLPDRPLHLVREMGDLMVEYRLTPEEGFVLDRLRSPRSVPELVRSCGLPQQRVMENLYSLWTAGLVTNRAPATSGKPRPYLKRDDQVCLTNEQLAERARVMRLALSMPGMDHYGALGIDTNVGHDEVMKAWRELASSCHPDRVAEPHLADMEEQLTGIYRRAEIAYELLSSPSARARYDQVRGAAADGPERTESGTDRQRRVAAARELAESNLQEARRLIESGRGRLAFTYLENASQVAHDEDSLLTLAQLLANDPAWGRLALMVLQRLTREYPSCVEAWIELASHWLRRDAPERHRKALERALAMDPESETSRELYQRQFGAKALKRVLERTLPLSG